MSPPAVPWGRLQASSSRETSNSPLCWQSHPEPSLSSFQPCTGAGGVPASPTSGSSNTRGPSPICRGGERVFSRVLPRPVLVPGRCRGGGCPGSGVPKGIGFPAHLRPDILSASPAPALVCRSQPGLKFH